MSSPVTSETVIGVFCCFQRLPCPLMCKQQNLNWIQCGAIPPRLYLYVPVVGVRDEMLPPHEKLAHQLLG